MLDSNGLNLIMSSSQEDTKSRLRRLIGDPGLALLDAATVAVFGLGGVGASCAEALVRGGVGGLVLIDKDAVEPSNINRQAIAFMTTIGQRKADVMRNMALDINPDARITCIDEFVTRENMGDVFDTFPKPDYIIDAFDTLTVKVALARYAEAAGIPSIHAGGSANRLDPTQLAFADLFSTEVCPLCRELRKIARDADVTHMQMLYSKERPVKVRAADDAARRERTELGTMSYMPPIMGQMMAGYVIRQLLGNVLDGRVA